MNIFYHITLVTILILQTVNSYNYEPYSNFYNKVLNITGITNSFIINLVLNSNKINKSMPFPNSHCKNDLKTFEKGLKLGELWALQMLDASSQFQSGFLEGNIKDYGNFEECVNVNDDTKNIQGGYFIIYFLINGGKINSTVYKTYYDHPVNMAACLPISCDEVDLQKMIDVSLKPVKLRPIVSSCFSKDSATTKIEYWQYIIIGLFAFIILLTIVGTFYDYFMRDCFRVNRHNPIIITVLSFSLALNGKNLFKKDKGEKSIKAVHGLRFLSACGILMIHRNLRDGQPFTNYISFDFEVRRWYYMIIMNAYLFVDIFFLISGLLVSYTALNKQLYEKGINLLRFYFHRYYRLTPVLCAVILLTLIKGVLCNGFHCIFNNDDLYCQSYWYLTLFYINNIPEIHYFGKGQCLGHSWYLSADMQMYLCSPLLFLVLRKCSILIFPVLILLLLFSTSLTFYLSYVNQLHSSYIIPYELLLLEAETVYSSFYTRAGPWIIGFGLGILLDQYNKFSYTLDKAFVVGGWITSLLCITGSMFGLYPFIQYDYQFSPFHDSLYKAFYRNIWALGFSWIIYACYTGHGGIVNKFLSSHFFHPLSRISYCFYLIHPFTQLMEFSDMIYPRQFTKVSQVSLYFGDVLYSILLATVLHLLIEAPSLCLEKIFINKTYPDNKCRNLEKKQNSSTVDTELDSVTFNPM